MVVAKKWTWSRTFQEALNHIEGLELVFGVTIGINIIVEVMFWQLLMR